MITENFIKDKLLVVTEDGLVSIFKIVNSGWYEPKNRIINNFFVFLLSGERTENNHR